MHKDIQEILFTETEIQARVAEMGNVLTDRYSKIVDEGGSVVLLSVLRGAAIFMADLARATEVPLEMDYMALSSYGKGAQSTGEVRVVKPLTTDIASKHVVVVEDILDTGLTLRFLLDYLQQYVPAQVEVVTLLRKQVPNQEPITCMQIGFECPNEFIVGYGLDYAERYRNLPYIGILKPEVYKKSK